MKQIVVLPAGWVVVGDTTISGDELTITNAAVIRTWGTTKGLGEIAFAGPTKNTVLDKCPPITAHIPSIIMRMSCVADRWKNV